MTLSCQTNSMNVASRSRRRFCPCSTDRSLWTQRWSQRCGGMVLVAPVAPTSTALFWRLIVKGKSCGILSSLAQGTTYCPCSRIGGEVVSGDCTLSLALGQSQGSPRAHVFEGQCPRGEKVAVHARSAAQAFALSPAPAWGPMGPHRRIVVTFMSFSFPSADSVHPSRPCGSRVCDDLNRISISSSLCNATA